MHTYGCALGGGGGGGRGCVHTYGCALGGVEGMCTYLWVCTGGVEGDVCIAMCVHWGS